MSFSIKPSSDGTSTDLAINGTTVLSISSAGVLTAITSPASTDRSLKLATTSMLSSALDFSKSLATSGWQKLPSGLIIQWGVAGGVGDDAQITTTFPLTFPTNCFVVLSTSGASSLGRSSFAEIHTISWTTSSVVFENLGNAGITTNPRWIAIGY